MIPPQLSNIPRPKGFYTQFKEWPITPLSSNMYWQPDDIVRFLINITQGVMDPYRSHIQITVQVPLQICPIGGQQVDGSAQSFIQQSVISSNQVEVERITAYDELARILTDLGFSQYVAEGRSVQGIGYSNQQTHKPWATAHTNLATQTYAQSTTGGVTAGFANSGLVMPTSAGLFDYGPAISSQVADSIKYMSPAMYFGSGNIACTPINPFWNVYWSNNTALIANGTSILSSYGRMANVRFEYMDKILARDYPDSSTSLLQSCPQIVGQNLSWNSGISGGFNPKNPYVISFLKTMSSQMNIYGNNHMMTIPTNVNLTGFQRPVSSQFARGTNEPMLSPTIPQIQVQNGIILPTKVPMSQKTFRIPLLSAICGLLIPPDQFTLLPLQALNNLLIQLTLSRYAMFSTGNSDIHQTDVIGMSIPQPRKWLLTNIQYNMHIYTFADVEVNMSIKQSLTRSINITSTGYALCSQFQLPNGAVIRNSWPIGCQYEDLCEIAVIMIPNDYQTKPWCRKGFRISNNITSMQIKLDTNFFPSQPIIGNAGNPQTLDNTGDNWPFYQMILLSTNRLFSVNHPYPRINQKNFAPNERCYNVNNTNTFYDPNMNQGYNYTFTVNSVNADTALGMQNFHENRYIGKAIYFFTWQPYGHSNKYLAGINTSGVRNFQIMFQSSPTNPFPRDQTMYIFARFNQLVRYTQQGIQVFGK